MQFRVIKMLRKTFEAQREKALMTFELLTENPAGIGDHSTEDFYKNAEEAAKALAEADDVLETLERYYPEQMVNIENHKNFCPLPWMHLYKDTDHTVKLCCADRGESLGNLSKNTFEEIKNNDNFISIRKQFLNDERPDRCRDCWLAEDNGRHSLRTSMLSYTQENKLYNEQANHHVGYLDFRTSNLCNLGCKICIPHFSSKLAEVWGEAGLLKNNGSLYHKGDKKYYTSFHKNRVKFKDIGTIITDKLFKIYC